MRKSSAMRGPPMALANIAATGCSFHGVIASLHLRLLFTNELAEDGPKALSPIAPPITPQTDLRVGFHVVVDRLPWKIRLILLPLFSESSAHRGCAYFQPRGTSGFTGEPSADFLASQMGAQHLYVLDLLRSSHFSLLIQLDGRRIVWRPAEETYTRPITTQTRHGETTTQRITLLFFFSLQYAQSTHHLLAPSRAVGRSIQLRLSPQKLSTSIICPR